MRKELWQNHSDRFFQLPLATQAQYDQEAAELSDERLRAFEGDLATMRTQLGIQRARAAEDYERRNPFNMEQCKWSADDMERLQVLWDQGGFTETKVQSLRDAAARAPEPPDMDDKLEVGTIVLEKAPEVEKPTWLPDVCNLRQHFLETGFRVRSEDPAVQPRYFAFCFAKQNPYALALARLKRRPLAAAVPLSRSSPNELHTWWLHDFVFDSKSFVRCDRDMVGWNEDLVDVIPHLVFMQGGRVASDLEPIGLADFLATLPAVRRVERAAAERNSAEAVSAAAKFVRENPWALHHLEEGENMIKRKRAEEDLEEEEADVADEVTEMADQIFEDLREIQAKCREEVVPEHFRITPLGGAWTLRQLGVLCDAYKAWAHGQEVCAWCDAYSLGKTARFNVSLYGFEGSVVMAKEWMNRMSFLYQAWLDIGSPRPFTYEEELLGQYQEPEEFTNFADGLTATAALRRVGEVRALRPAGHGHW